jgi:hypothetical protein
MEGVIGESAKRASSTAREDEPVPVDPGPGVARRGKPADAESWFKRPPRPALRWVTRTAYLGLGDVRLAQATCQARSRTISRRWRAGIQATAFRSARSEMNALGKADPGASPAKQL